MGDGQFDNLEQKCTPKTHTFLKIYIYKYTIDDGATLACFYSSMGLNRELCSDLIGAVNYH